MDELTLLEKVFLKYPLPISSLFACISKKEKDTCVVNQDMTLALSLYVIRESYFHISIPQFHTLEKCKS